MISISPTVMVYITVACLIFIFVLLVYFVYSVVKKEQEG